MRSCAYVQQNAFGLGAVIAYFSIFAFGYTAYYSEFGIVGWLGAVFLEGVQVGVAAALVVIFSGFRRVRYVSVLGAILLTALALAGIAGGFLGAQVRPHLDGWLWIGFAILPPGWINAAFAYGLIEGNPLGWLWLLPAFGVIAIAYKKMQTRFGIKEFGFLPGGQVEAFPADSWAGFKAKPFAFFKNRVRNPAPSLELFDSKKRIRAGQFLRLQANEGGWAPGFVCFLLSRREKILLDCYLAYHPQWTNLMKWLSYCCLGVIALLAIPLRGESTILPAFPGICFLIFAPLSPWFLFPNDNRQNFTSLSAVLPSLPKEHCRLFAKLQLGLCLLILPGILIFGGLFSWRIGASPLRGMFFGARYIYAILGVQPWMLLLLIPKRRSRVDWSPLPRVAPHDSLCLDGHADCHCLLGNAARCLPSPDSRRSHLAADHQRRRLVLGFAQSDASQRRLALAVWQRSYSVGRVLTRPSDFIPHPDGLRTVLLKRSLAQTSAVVRGSQDPAPRILHILSVKATISCPVCGLPTTCAGDDSI